MLYNVLEFIKNKTFVVDEIRIVRDGKFGSEVSDHIWTGLVGEVYRKVSYTLFSIYIKIAVLFELNHL